MRRIKPLTLTELSPINIDTVDLKKFAPHKTRIKDVICLIHRAQTLDYYTKREALLNLCASTLENGFNSRLRGGVIMQIASPVISSISGSISERVVEGISRFGSSSGIKQELYTASGDETDKSLIERIEKSVNRSFNKKQKLAERGVEGSVEEGVMVDDGVDGRVIAEANDNALISLNSDGGRLVVDGIKLGGDDVLHSGNENNSSLPIFSLKKNEAPKQESWFNLISDASANVYQYSATNAIMQSLPILESASFYGTRTLINIARANPYVLGATVLSSTATLAHKAAEFESKHIWLNEDFNDWITNPLISNSVKERLFESMKNDSLLRSSVSIISGNAEISGSRVESSDGLRINNDLLSLRLKSLSEILDDNFGSKGIFEGFDRLEARPSILFTPDDGERISGMGRLDGFEIENNNRFRIPGFDIHEIGLDDLIEAFPDDRSQWNNLDRLILFKTNSGANNNRKQKEIFNECEKGQSQLWKSFEKYRVIGDRQVRTNGLSGNKREYYGWDNLHKEIEVYNADGKPVRAISPVTGRDKGKDVSKHKKLEL